MPKSSRPNFLLFITDQHRADFLGCYGHPVLRTPNIDSIAQARHGVRPLLCRKPGLPAEPRQPDDRAHALGARRAQQRHPAVDEGGDLRRSAARRRLYAPRWSARAICRTSPAARSDHQAASRRARAIHEPSAGLRQSLRDDLDDPKYEQETPQYWTQGRRACADAVLRLRPCHAGAQSRRRGGRRLRPLARCARPQGEEPARAEEQPAARLHGAAGLSHRDPGGALRHRVPRRSRRGLSRRARTPTRRSS